MIVRAVATLAAMGTVTGVLAAGVTAAADHYAPPVRHVAARHAADHDRTVMTPAGLRVITYGHAAGGQLAASPKHGGGHVMPHARLLHRPYWLRGNGRWWQRNNNRNDQNGAGQ